MYEVGIPPPHNLDKPNGLVAIINNINNIVKPLEQFQYKEKHVKTCSMSLCPLPSNYLVCSKKTPTLYKSILYLSGS